MGRPRTHPHPILRGLETLPYTGSWVDAMECVGSQWGQSSSWGAKEISPDGQAGGAV